MAADLVRRKVDVIVASSQAPALAAKRATTTIPIVMINATDPVQAGLVASLARPGGNVTGLSQQLTPEICAKQLQLLKETSTQARARCRAAQPFHDSGPARVRGRRASLDLRVQFVEVKSREDLGARSRRWSGIVSTHCWCRETPFCSRSGSASPSWPASIALPGIYAWREFTELGGLMSYSARITEQFRRAAVYVDKILRGASPATLPVESPTQYELVINLKTAKALGLAIPPALLVRADELIQ